MSRFLYLEVHYVLHADTKGISTFQRSKMTIEANYEFLILVAQNEAAEDIISDLAGMEYEKVMERYREINKGTQSILHSAYHPPFSLTQHRFRSRRE